MPRIPTPISSSLIPCTSDSHSLLIKIADAHRRSLSSSLLKPQTPDSVSRSNGTGQRSGPSTPGSGYGSPSTRSTHLDPKLRFRQHPEAREGSDIFGEDKEDEGEDGLEGSDEDEFGLPTLTTRPSTSRKSDTKSFDPGGNRQGIFGDSTGSGTKLSYNRPRANSSDIAEVRDTPEYPSAKRSDGKILRPQYKEILRDPANSLHLISHPPLVANPNPKETEAHTARISRINKFKRILQASSIVLSDLRDSCWSGIPQEVRAMSWQLLLGYLPPSSERRIATLERKRKEYLDAVRQAFDRGTSFNSPTGKRTSGVNVRRGLDEALWHQISIDVPRTSPHLKLYSYETTQRSLERILYVWAIRHPASGYVQGINDLVTPFWQVFLGSYITDSDIRSGMDPGQLPKPVLDAVEADSFWCLTKLLDGIQDNYIFAQPGIVRQVAALRDLTLRIDSGLAKHLENEGVEFMQFSFRWMNCLLMREVPVSNIIRMWDTYMAEEHGFSDFHLYVCAAFLVKWSEQLVKMDFQVWSSKPYNYKKDPLT